MATLLTALMTPSLLSTRVPLRSGVLRNGVLRSAAMLAAKPRMSGVLRMSTAIDSGAAPPLGLALRLLPPQFLTPVSMPVSCEVQ